MAKMNPVDRFWSKVEKGDGCWLWKGHLVRGGYGHFWLNGKHVYAHRFSWELERGPLGEGQEIDHACHTRNCVRPEHLRAASHRQNCQNLLGKVEGEFSSAFPGVTWHKGAQKWMAQIRVDDQNKYLGLFGTEVEASRAYLKEAGRGQD